MNRILAQHANVGKKYTWPKVSCRTNVRVVPNWMQIGWHLYHVLNILYHAVNGLAARLRLLVSQILYSMATYVYLCVSRFRTPGHNCPILRVHTSSLLLRCCHSLQTAESHTTSFTRKLLDSRCLVCWIIIRSG